MSHRDVGMLEAEQQMWVANQKRDLLELRHRQILARVEWLNQLNTQVPAWPIAGDPGRVGVSAAPRAPPAASDVRLTCYLWRPAAQAMLVAGSAVASLGGESLQTIDDADLKKLALDTVFVGSTAGDCPPLDTSHRPAPHRKRAGVAQQARIADKKGPRPAPLPPSVLSLANTLFLNASVLVSMCSDAVLLAVGHLHLVQPDHALADDRAHRHRRRGRQDCGQHPG